jgi:hypothetical protein
VPAVVVSSQRMKKVLIACLVGIAAMAAGRALLSHDGAIQYGWVVFGPDAGVKVLVGVQDQGRLFFVDRDGDGDFDGPEERFENPTGVNGVSFKSTDGSRTYKLISLSHYEVENHRGLFLEVEVQGPVSYRQYADVPLNRWRSTSQRAHLDGPLAIDVQRISWKLPENLALKRGDKPTDLRVTIGTFDERTRSWAVVRVMDVHEKQSICLFPDDVRPVVDVEYPPKTPSAPAVKRRYVLEEFC